MSLILMRVQLIEKAEDYSLDTVPEEDLALTLSGDCQVGVSRPSLRAGIVTVFFTSCTMRCFFASERTLVDDNDV